MRIARWLEETQSRPHSPILISCGGALERESKGPSILVPRPRRLRGENRAMGTRMEETVILGRIGSENFLITIFEN